jgi:hypothetical protein
MSETTRMHQTTIRFVPRVWAQLEREARRHGVSSAQYVREATLARLSYDARARDGSDDFLRYDGVRVGAALQVVGERGAASQAVYAEARLARERARSTREAAKSLHARPFNGEPANGGDLDGVSDPEPKRNDFDRARAAAG